MPEAISVPVLFVSEPIVLPTMVVPIELDDAARAAVDAAQASESGKLLIAPRLGPVREREPEPPLRFAQLVGFVFAVVGAAGYLFGAPVVGAVATGFALVAALLNAAVGFCLGCELHLLLRRALAGRSACTTNPISGGTP